MLFYPADISHFHSFGCHMGSQLWFLLQKCNHGMCDQNSHKQGLCFFVQHTFSIFMSLAVARGPNLAPCCKSVVLTSTIKNHIKIIYVPFTSQAFSIFILLAVTWRPNFDPCDKSVILTGAIKIYMKVVFVFLPSWHFPFSFLWLSLGVPICTLAAKM